MTASSLLIVPTFGALPRYGTNPIAFAAPARSHPFMLFDAAMSSVASNKIGLARRVGADMEPGWIAEPDGTPIMDERPAPAGNFNLLPLGGTREQGSHKGYGLGLLVEVMTTLLAGDIPRMIERDTKPRHSFIAYNIEAFTDLEAFKDTMDRMLQTLIDTPTAPGHERVLYPGLPEHESEQRRRARGHPAPPRGDRLVQRNHRRAGRRTTGDIVTGNRYTFDEMRSFHAEWSLATWDKGGPLMRYTFRRMTEFFPHAVIRRDGPVVTLASTPRDDVAVTQVQTTIGAMSLDAYVRAGPVNGVVALHHGDVIYERYPRMNADDLHLTMSVSKVFTSTLVAMLEDRGELNSRNTVEAYLPEVRGSGWEGVSVRDVLDMASGIDCDQTGADVYTNPKTPYYGFEASLGWLPPTPETVTSTYEYVAKLGRLKEPGQAFDYSSANTFLLAWIAERISGQPYADLLGEEIWSRIGAEGDAVISIVPASGATTVHAGLSARLRDIARFGLLFTPSRDIVSDSPIVSDRYLREIVAGGRPDVFANGITGQSIISRMPDDPPRHNSHQWDYVMPDGDFYKGGYGGQGLYISPTRDLVIAFAGAFEAGGPDSEMASIARQIARSGLFDD